MVLLDTDIINAAGGGGGVGMTTGSCANHYIIANLVFVGGICKIK